MVSSEHALSRLQLKIHQRVRSSQNVTMQIKGNILHTESVQFNLCPGDMVMFVQYCNTDRVSFHWVTSLLPLENTQEVLFV